MGRSKAQLPDTNLARFSDSGVNFGLFLAICKEGHRHEIKKKSEKLILPSMTQTLTSACVQPRSVSSVVICSRHSSAVMYVNTIKGDQLKVCLQLDASMARLQPSKVCFHSQPSKVEALILGALT